MKIELNENGIWIDGSCQVILASSLFYFRIPQERWEQRMKLLKAAGYNAIDVYFPWNYHETAPGKWNFEENRDVERFLKIAKENELFCDCETGSVHLLRVGRRCDSGMALRRWNSGKTGRSGIFECDAYLVFSYSSDS